MEKNRTISANSAIIGTYNLLLIIFLCSVFYFAQEIIIPIVTAALLTFVFSPLVNYLESYLGRFIPIVIVVILLFISAGMIGYTLYQQVISFSNQLPSYNENIHNKFESIKQSSANIFGSLTTTIEGITKTNESSLIKNKSEMNSNILSGKKPIPVEVINNQFQFTGYYTLIFGSIFNFLAYTFLIMILLFFMLYYREDLNRRFLYVLGKGQLSATTQAIEDAGNRVSKYLMALLIVNIFYGVCVTIALSIIGIPNAALWGIIGGVLRFIPYFGFIISALFPIFLSFIISNEYLIVFETIGFYLVIELLVSYLIEPILYGQRTGVSPLALIIAAIFWTWIWGPMGLVLAVPLTVCLVVIGTYLPRFESISVLFGDKKTLGLHVDLYYRILAEDINEVINFIDSYLKDHTLIDLYDNIIIPMIIEVEKDYRGLSLVSEQKEYVFQTIADIINDLYSRPDKLLGIEPLKTQCKIFCIGARSERDDLASQILTQILMKLKITTTYISNQESLANLKDVIINNKTDIVCISAVLPTSIINAKYMANKLQQSGISSAMIVVLWNHQTIPSNEAENLKNLGITHFVSSMEEAVRTIVQICKTNGSK